MRTLKSKITWIFVAIFLFGVAVNYFFDMIGLAIASVVILYALFTFYLMAKSK